MSVSPWRLLLLPLLCWSSSQAQSPASPHPSARLQSLKDPSDGWLDLSAFLSKPGGFFPLAMPVTEPAIGYGIAGGPVFLRPNTDAGAQGFARPDISVLGGLYTSNHTWGVAALDSSKWKNDRIETIFGAGHASVNLKYALEGGGQAELGYNLTMSGGIAKAKFKMGNSKLYGGIRYLFLETSATAASGIFPGLAPKGLGRTNRLAGPAASLTFDSRNNILTPTRGLYSESTYSYFDPSFGGTINFQRFDQTALAFVPLHPRWTLGIRGEAAFSFGDPVFYARPFVSLRGVPAMRYQRQNMLQTEWELRWQFWKRFSAVGFGGVGTVWNAHESRRGRETVAAGGMGFRYELARKFGLHYGVDVAHGPQGYAFYFVFGSAWLRP
ncbi:MAG: BamA/TamA family outer membrane protein [Acidobacteria bacterium]|nr:BamA/TamA family outer membrane protein [Acidobacteriota bacterium]